jgi:uncharacterized phiE125 gp8 family phage protein
MNYLPIIVTPPIGAPVSLQEARSHLRVDDGDSDTEIEALIDAATSYLDGPTGVLGRCLMAQTWRQDYDCFERCMRLPLFPALEIVSVKYDDANGVEQTIDSANYDLRHDARGAYVQFKDTFSFPQTKAQRPAIRIEAGYGYADADSIPVALKQAILLLIGHWFDSRSAVVASQSGASAIVLPFAVDALIAPFRRVSP